MKDRENQKILVCFGDSTTAERIVAGYDLLVYARILAGKLNSDRPPCKVINAGIPGDTTSRALQRLACDVLDCRPQIVVIQFGINDSWIDNPHEQNQPRVPLAIYQKNLVQIIAELATIQSRIILMTPNALGHAVESWRKDNLARYADCVRQIAQARSISLVDIWNRFTDYEAILGQSIDQLLLDGMHPNELGHSFIAASLMQII